MTGQGNRMVKDSEQRAGQNDLSLYRSAGTANKMHNVATVTHGAADKVPETASGSPGPLTKYPEPPGTRRRYRMSSPMM